MDLIKKFLGLVLLVGGLIIIFYSLYSSYNIFTAKSAAPEIFQPQALTILEKNNSQGIEAQLQELLSKQLGGLLPSNSISQLLNLISWSIFAGIFILGGGQISGLGIKLIK